MGNQRARNLGLKVRGNEEDCKHLSRTREKKREGTEVLEVGCVLL